MGSAFAHFRCSVAEAYRLRTGEESPEQRPSSNSWVGGNARSEIRESSLSDSGSQAKVFTRRNRRGLSGKAFDVGALSSLAYAITSVWKIVVSTAARKANESVPVAASVAGGRGTVRHSRRLIPGDAHSLTKLGIAVPESEELDKIHEALRDRRQVFA